MTVKPDLSEVLFFTQNMSLRQWSQSGMLAREVALYKRLLLKNVGVTFVTYGSSADLAYRNQITGMDLICNRWRLPQSLYIRFLFGILPMFLPDNAVIKSNQMLGANVAMQAAHYWGRCFVARCGYLYAYTMGKKYGKNSAEAQKARSLEKKVLTNADRVVVTTQQMQQKIITDYQLSPNKIRVIPNYVNADLFSPSSKISRVPNRICFIGRLDSEKNLSALLNACAGLDIELYMAGRGGLEQELRDLASSLDLDAHFLGSVPNEQLPALINSSTVFILSSLYEGHPKSLLEAMSCGVPVIGTDVPGIREVLRHGETGFLCGTDSDDIRSAIREVLGDPCLQKRLGANARQVVIEQFALGKVVELELQLLRELNAKQV